MNNSGRIERESPSPISPPHKAHIVDFSDELLIAFFSTLAYSDLLKACLVCRKWKEIALDTMARRELLITEGAVENFAIKTKCRALATLGEAQKAVELTEMISWNWNKANILCRISQILAANNKSDEAIEVAKLISDSHLKVYAFQKISKSLIAVGKFDQAVQVAKMVSETRFETWAISKNSALRKIAKRLAAVCKFDQAAEVAKMISDSERADSTLW